MDLDQPTPFLSAVAELLRRIEETIPAAYQHSIEVILVGGVAVHVWTNVRTSADAEAVFSHRMIFPRQLVARYKDIEGSPQAVRFDTNYASTISLLHPDFASDAVAIGTIGRFDVRILSPVDLAVSKIGRYSERDAGDIAALAAAGLLSAPILEARCREALAHYVGDPTMIEFNLRDALETISAPGEARGR